MVRQKNEKGNGGKNFLLIILFLFLSFASFAQYEIRGQVVGGDDQSPLPGANVFFANTTKGSSTNANGEFAFHNLPPGRLQLVVSFIGYETLVLDLKTPFDKRLKIILKPSAKQLKAVTIYGKKQKHSDWLTYLRLFKENFIGQTSNARLCELVNPKILSFDNDKDQLVATADTSIVIINKSLGYKIKFLMETFSYTYFTHMIRYKGQFVYEALVPSGNEERKEWATNRLHAYYGSQMHFLRSLYRKRLLEEGFFVSLNKEGYDKKGNKTNVAFADTVIFVEASAMNNRKMRMPIVYYDKILDSVRSTPEQPVLSFQGNLEISYVNELESFEYQQLRYPAPARVGLRSFQHSQLFLLNPYFHIDPNGQVYMEDILSKGYWSFELAADNLPFDYDPEVDRALFSARELTDLFRTSEIIEYGQKFQKE